MINDINNELADFFQWHDTAHTRPTQRYLSEWLGLSHRTLSRVLNGCYAQGKPYSEHPVRSRKIDNKDFGTVQKACQMMKKSHR